MALAGYHWLWLDNEHSAHSYESLQNVIRTADDVGIVPIVRVAQRQYDRIAQALDIGAAGIIVPRVETADDVREIISHAKYPPVGARGFGMRSLLFNRLSMTQAERMNDQINRRFVFLQVESRAGIENLEAMIEVAPQSITGVFMGPADFQADIGRPDSPDDPELLSAAERIASVCKRFGISAGMPVKNAAEARLWAEKGFNLICCGADDDFVVKGASDTCRQLSSFLE